MRRILVILALSVLPVALPAQHAADSRAGVTPRVTFTLPARTDTAASDSIAPHRARVANAVVGGLFGAVVGGLAGAVYAQQAQKHCGDGPCLAGLAIPFLAGFGLVGGAIAGALWPTH